MQIKTERIIGLVDHSTRSTKEIAQAETSKIRKNNSYQHTKTKGQ